MKNSALLLIFSLSTGCVSFYETPDNGAELSTLRFEKGYDRGVGIGTSTTQSYWVVENRLCNKKSRIAFFSWTNEAPSNRDVEANKPISILAETRRYTGRAASSGTFIYGETDTNVCPNNITFTPKPGRTYTVRQNTIVGTSCQMKVVTDVDGESLDITSVDNPDFCAQSSKD